MQEKACEHKSRHDMTGQWRENLLHVLHWMNCRYLNCAIGPIYGVPVIYLSTNLNIPIWELEYIYNESEERIFESEEDTRPHSTLSSPLSLPPFCFCWIALLSLSCSCVFYSCLDLSSAADLPLEPTLPTCFWRPTFGGSLALLQVLTLSLSMILFLTLFIVFLV